MDGRVHLCCKDFNGEVIVGDLKKESFKEVYRNFEKLRKLHLKREFKRIPLCDECMALVQSSTRWW